MLKKYLGMKSKERESIFKIHRFQKEIYTPCLKKKIDKLFRNGFFKKKIEKTWNSRGVNAKKGKFQGRHGKFDYKSRGQF